MKLEDGLALTKMKVKNTFIDCDNAWDDGALCHDDPSDPFLVAVPKRQSSDPTPGMSSRPPDSEKSNFTTRKPTIPTFLDERIFEDASSDKDDFETNSDVVDSRTITLTQSELHFEPEPLDEYGGYAPERHFGSNPQEVMQLPDSGVAGSAHSIDTMGEVAAVLALCVQAMSPSPQQALSSEQIKSLCALSRDIVACPDELARAAMVQAITSRKPEVDEKAEKVAGPLVNTRQHRVPFEEQPTSKDTGASSGPIRQPFSRIPAASSNGKTPSPPPDTDVTTMMLRNLPQTLTKQMLVKELDNAGFSRAYDFLYLPIALCTNTNRGYAFINFTNPEWALTFQLGFHGQKVTWHNDSETVLSVVPAAMQGFEANYAHYSNANVNRGDPRARPIFLREPKLGNQPKQVGNLNDAAPQQKDQQQKQGPGMASAKQPKKIEQPQSLSAASCNSFAMDSMDSAVPPPGASLSTMMMRNLPPTLTRQMLQEELDNAGFRRTYDFLYLPIDLRTDTNRGYAFINFISPECALSFQLAFEGQTVAWQGHRKSVLSVVPAALQGFEANYTHYSNAFVNRGDPKARPLFLREPKLGICDPRGTHKNNSLIDTAARQMVQQQDLYQDVVMKQQLKTMQLQAAQVGIATPQRSPAPRVATECSVTSSQRQQRAYCGHCGERVRVNYKFCEFCGATA